MAHDPGGKVRTLLAPGIRAAAIMSPCGRYRPWLSRRWGEVDAPMAVFLGMNPSTADAEANDPTVARETGFTRREGLTSYGKCNVMDFRATDPKGLKAPGVEPRSLACLYHIQVAAEFIAKRGGIFVAAWGALPKAFRPYADEALAAVRRVGIPVFCLGLTQDGSPRHPLYLRSDAPLIPLPDRATG